MKPSRTISPSRPCTLLAMTLLVGQVQAQLSGGSPSQLRPPSGAHIAPQGSFAPPAKTTPLVAQTNTRTARKALLVDLPVTDFGKIYVQQTQKLSVTLRKLVEGNPDNANKTVELPEIRISGAQAAAFVASPPQCFPKIEIVKMDYASAAVASYTCTATVTFHPTTEGPQTALLVASFPDGDQFTGRLSGISQPTSVSMPAPGGVRSSVPLSNLGTQSSAPASMVPETLDFGSLPPGNRKTLRVATQYPAGSLVLPHLGGAQIQPNGSAFSLGETALALKAKPGEKASFTITFSPQICCGTVEAYFTFKDADGRPRKLNLKGNAWGQ